MQKTLQDTDTGKTFLLIILVVCYIKQKTDKWDYMKLHCFFTENGNQQESKEAVYGTGENRCEASL